jgi:hypothetical protein
MASFLRAIQIWQLDHSPEHCCIVSHGSIVFVFVSFPTFILLLQQFSDAVSVFAFFCSWLGLEKRAHVVMFGEAARGNADITHVGISTETVVRSIVHLAVDHLAGCLIEL